MAQARYWSPRWQAMEAVADEDLQNGRFCAYETIEDMIVDLNKGYQL